jgi:hypothetical protein
MVNLFLSLLDFKYVILTVKNINHSTDNMVKISETADKILTYVTKVTGVSTGDAGTTKRIVDMLEAIVCQDGICADGLSMATLFISRPNVTTVVTVPLSIGCNSFDWCCKRAKKCPGVVTW